MFKPVGYLSLDLKFGGVKLSKGAQEVFRKVKETDRVRFSELQDEGFDQSKVARAAKELEEEGLARVEEEEEVAYSLTDKGRRVLREGSPEYRLVEELRDGPKPVTDLKVPVDIALGEAKKRDWISLEDGQAVLTKQGEKAEDKVQSQLEDENYGPDHVDRGLVNRITEKTRILTLTEKGSQVKPGNIDNRFNVEASGKPAERGKKHFYRQVIDEARQAWLEMGFSEMRGDYVVPGFTCFDSLYIAQDHPARDLQDTFFLQDPEKTELKGEVVDRVKQTHENGWKTGSTGWGYEWSEEEASRNVLRTHTTAVSARKLTELEPEDLPAKKFIISRAFRNETVDSTHLPDFDQAEGIVVGKDLNFSHLKGYISRFFRKMGFDEFRLVPTYYPYTEMSVEVQIRRDGEWLGMGGAGMFRPEVVQPLMQVDAQVLAWGLGIGRIAMNAAELEDIRELYGNDKNKVLETPLWRRN